MNTKRILAQVIGFAAIIASFLACQAAYAESVGPCAGQSNIAASYKLNKLGFREYDRRNYIGAATFNIWLRAHAESVQAPFAASLDYRRFDN